LTYYVEIRIGGPQQFYLHMQLAWGEEYWNKIVWSW
jgi:hypothetical protein